MWFNRLTTQAVQYLVTNVYDGERLAHSTHDSLHRQRHGVIGPSATVRNSAVVGPKFHCFGLSLICRTISRTASVQHHDVSGCCVFAVHCVSKNIPDILNFNFKTNHQILIIFGKNISDTTCHQITVQFPPHLMYASALPKEIRSSETCVKINRKLGKHPQHYRS